MDRACSQATQATYFRFFKMLIFVGVCVATFLAGTSLSHATPIVGASLFVRTTGEVVARFVSNSGSFINDLFLDTPANSLGIIFTNQTTPIDTQVSLGNFTAGTEMVFRLHVNDTGDDFFTGPASRNPDNKPHIAADPAFTQTETLVSFEDLFDTPEFPGGFNDMSFSLTNVDASAIPEPAALPVLIVGMLWLQRYRRST